MGSMSAFSKKPVYGIACYLFYLLLAPISHASTQVPLPDFTRLFAEASPAIVNISTLAKPKSKVQLYGQGIDELPEIFRRYFGIPHPDAQSPNTPQPLSLGSGFIISDDGYLLTNNHVVEGADEIIVKLSDRSEVRAKLIGADKRSDLALLKLNTKRKLPVVKLGDSDAVQPGQWVAAIGSPFNFEYSITKGIISALNRSLPSDAYVPFMQTDVPINPGNSGGPLFNMKGEVIGINSQIFTRSGGFMGLSFAIPVNHVLWAVEQIKANGYVTRGWLGVTIQEVDRELAESFGLEKPMGALINQIVPGGPADVAKFRPGDIITRFNGRPIHRSSDLPMAVGVTTPGERRTIDYLRNGKRLTAQVTVGELPDERGPQHESSPRKALASNRLGIQVAELDDDYRGKLQLDRKVSGLVVIKVLPGAGKTIGLRQGDVITDVNGAQVVTVQAFEAAVKTLPNNRSISMRVIRNGQPGYITFRLKDQ